MYKNWRRKVSQVFDMVRSDSVEVIGFVVLLAPAVCLKGHQVEDVAQEAQCLSGMHRSLDWSPVLHKTRHGDKLPASSALRRRRQQDQKFKATFSYIANLRPLSQTEK